VCLLCVVLLVLHVLLVISDSVLVLFFCYLSLVAFC
jgi:hypothetical protein